MSEIQEKHWNYTQECVNVFTTTISLRLPGPKNARAGVSIISAVSFGMRIALLDSLNVRTRSR